MAWLVLCLIGAGIVAAGLFYGWRLGALRAPRYGVGRANHGKWVAGIGISVGLVLIGLALRMALDENPIVILADSTTTLIDPGPSIGDSSVAGETTAPELSTPSTSALTTTTPSTAESLQTTAAIASPIRLGDLQPIDSGTIGGGTLRLEVDGASELSGERVPFGITLYSGCGPSALVCSSYVEFGLSRDFSCFTATIGIDELSYTSQDPVFFEIEVDGSPHQTVETRFSDPKELSVDIENTIRLRLIARPTNVGLRAVWANALLHRSPVDNCDELAE